MDFIENRTNLLDLILKNFKNESNQKKQEFIKIMEFINKEISNYYSEQINKFNTIDDDLVTIRNQVDQDISELRKEFIFEKFTKEELSKKLEIMLCGLNKKINSIISESKSFFEYNLNLLHKLYNNLKKEPIDLKEFQNLISHPQRETQTIINNFINSNISHNSNLIIGTFNNYYDSKNLLNQAFNIDLEAGNNSNPFSFLNRKRISEGLKAKMEQYFNRSYDDKYLMGLKLMIENSIKFSKTNQGITSISEIGEGEAGNFMLSKFIKIKIFALKKVNVDYLDNFSLFFKSYIIAENKDVLDNNVYFIGGELKVHDAYKAVFQLIKSLLKEIHWCISQIEFHNFCFLEELFCDLSKKKNLKCEVMGMTLNEVMSKSSLDSDKIKKEREYYLKLL